MKTLKTILPICIAIALSCDWGSFAFGAGSFIMKLIPLSESSKKYVGYFAKVDDEDYSRLMQWKWYVYKAGNTHYAFRKQKLSPNKWRSISMHFEILKTPKGMLVDHKDHDGLNNQKNNIRTATKSQNCRNVTARKDCTSKYLGVQCVNGIYRALIKHKEKKIHIGSFYTEIEAAEAYNKSASEYFGEFANLNVIVYPENFIRLGSSTKTGPKNKTSKYTGVTFLKRINKYQSSIYFNGKTIYIGVFSNQHDAALAYNKKSIELFGDKVKLNIVE